MPGPLLIGRLWHGTRRRRQPGQTLAGFSQRLRTQFERVSDPSASGLSPTTSMGRRRQTADPNADGQDGLASCPTLAPQAGVGPLASVLETHLLGVHRFQLDVLDTLRWRLGLDHPRDHEVCLAMARLHRRPLRQ